MKRREFLAWSAATLVLGAAKTRVASASGAATTLWASCRADGDGRFFLSAFDDTGRVHLDIPLPARGHGVTVHPSRRQCAVFARRPGTFLWIADIAEGRVVHRIESPKDRHYYGHGIFDPLANLWRVRL